MIKPLRRTPEVTKLVPLPSAAAQQIVTPQEASVRVAQALIQFAASMPAVADTELPNVINELRSFVGVVEAAEDALKQRLLKRIREDGLTVTEKGTKRLNMGEFTAEMQPTRTGFDSKKVEAMLRANDIEVQAVMDPIVTFKVNEPRLLNSKLTEDQREACRYDVNYRLIIKKATEQQESNDE